MEVEVRQSKIAGAGRGLFATKDFAPGDVLFTIDRPYVAEVDINRMQDTCAWCFVRGETDPENRRRAARLLQPTGTVEIKPCSACKRVKYCSKACQVKSWKREHKYECKFLAPKTRPDVPHGVRAVIKLLGRLKNDPDGKDEKLLDILQFQPASDHECREFMKKQNPERYDDFEMLSFAAWKYADEPKIGQMDSLAIAKGLFFNVISNTISLSAPYDDTSLGIGFDPLMCSANHSCDPNTVVVFNQPSVIVRALRKIKKGEEIFMRYIDTTNPLSVRQAELMDSYYFKCRCSKCLEGPTSREDQFLKSPSQLSSEYCKIADSLIQRHKDRLDQFLAPNSVDLGSKRVAAIEAEAFAVSGTTFDFYKGNENASEDEIRDALKLCLNSGMWDMTRQPVPHLVRALLINKIAARETYQSWRISAKMYWTITPKLHPETFFPDRLIDAWTLATITNQLTSPAHRELYMEVLHGGLDLRLVFMGLLFEVHGQLESSFGLQSPFGRIVDSVYRQCVAGMDISIGDVRQQVKETWPKFEVVAKSVDILSM